MEFGKIIIYVNDIAAALSFYDKAFGLQTRFHSDRGYGEVQIDAVTLVFATFETGQRHLPNGYTAARPPEAEVSLEIALVTTDVEEAFGHAVEAGATPLKQPEPMPWGQISSYLRAPDGTVIDLSSPLQGN